MSVQQEVFDFIISILPDQSIEFDADVNLLETGAIDSVAVMELIVWAEDHFQIGIDPDDLVPENFQTLNTIAAFIETCEKVA